MARLCIRIAPNSHPTDPGLNVMRTQPGDVVEIMEDGHVWSSAELNCGQYRFIDVPGIAASVLSNLVAAKYFQKKMTARRQFALDKTALTSGAWTSRTTATKAQIDAIVIVRV